MYLFDPGYIERVLKDTKIKRDVIEKLRQFLFADLKRRNYI